MKRGFASRRSAEEFDSLVTGRTAGGRSDAGEYAELLAVVSSLRAVPEVQARPEYVADLRGRLMAEARSMASPARTLDAETVARLTPRQRRGAGERRLATALGGFAVVAATGSMAMASQGALPGDVLYPVKRAIENAQTNLQSDDAGRAGTLIGHAEQRLTEVEALSRDGADGATVAGTLQDFTEQTGQATELALDEYSRTGDRASIQELRTFTSSSMARLTRLGDRVPVEARPALIAAAQTVSQADTAAFQACPTCGEAPITELPTFAHQPLDPLMSAGSSPSATSAPPDITEILARVEREAAEEPETREREREPRQPSEGSERPEQPGAEAPTEEPGEEPTQPGGPLDKLTEGVEDLLDPDKSDGGSTRSGDGGSGGSRTTKNGVGEVTKGVVDGVTGLLGGLLP